MSINREALAWAGGFFEGEGTISVALGSRPQGWFPYLGIKNTDAADLKRFWEAVGCIGKLGKWEDNGRLKRSRTWRTNKFEHVQAVIAMLWPWLSERIKKRYKALFRKWVRRTPKWPAYGMRKKYTLRKKIWIAHDKRIRRVDLRRSN